MRPRRESAVNQHRRSSHPFGFVTGEKQRHRGDVIWLAGALNRLRLRKGLLAARRLVAGDGRNDTARAYAVDTDAILA